jgi:hypothetical protein
MHARDLIRALLARSASDEHLDTGDALEVLKIALDELNEKRSAADVLNDMLTKGGPGDVKLLIELEVFENDKSTERMKALGAVLEYGDSMARLDVLLGPDQVGKTYYGTDVDDVLTYAAHQRGPFGPDGDPFGPTAGVPLKQVSDAHRDRDENFERWRNQYRDQPSPPAEALRVTLGGPYYRDGVIPFWRCSGCNKYSKGTAHEAPDECSHCHGRP